MALFIKISDARGVDIAGPVLITTAFIGKDGSSGSTVFAHSFGAPFTVPVLPNWARATVTIDHDDYSPVTITLLWDAGGTLSWSDPATQLSVSGGNQTLNVPLARVRFAPGQLPPFDLPTGDEKGIYVPQIKGVAQKYAGLGFLLSPVEHLRMLTDYTPAPAAGATAPVAPTCLKDLAAVNGWPRYNWTESAKIDAGANGGFVWLEYGSRSTKPQQPRYLVAVWAPASAVKDNAVDMLVFQSPSTANDLYPQSRFPFRDKYPYTALKKESIDPDTRKPVPAKVQPYALLGYKYLFSPTHLVPMTIASAKPLLVIMPILPHPDPASSDHAWRPFNSQAGLYRLLLEVKLFLEREGYNTGTFNFQRFNGAVAPMDGTAAPPPPPAFSAQNRPLLNIRSIVTSAYSSGSIALNSLLTRGPLLGSATDYPPDLFGADPAEFEKRWQQFWGLDLFLGAKSGVDRAKFEKALLAWLSVRDARRLRVYHGGWTNENQKPATFYPALYAKLNTAPQIMTHPKLSDRWAADVRERAGHWNLTFFSAAALRSTVRDPAQPSFPIEDGSKGDPPAAIHGFAAQLGFGHAALLR